MEQPTNYTILHKTVQLEGEVDPYYKHECEVLLFQIGVLFQVEIRSKFNTRWSNNLSQWSHQQNFESLSAASNHFAKVVAKPQAFVSIGMPSNYNYMWGRAKKINYKTLVRYDRPTDFDPARLAQEIAAERAILPNEPLAGEVVRHLWGREEQTTRAALRDFAQSVSLTYGNWSHWKWLYKQAETNHDSELLPIFLVRLDQLAAVAVRAYADEFAWLKRGPSQKTIDYMKRRARRYLRQQARQNPNRYVELAAQVLGATPATLDLDNQWLALDIMFGRSGRYGQSSHGRGKYVLQRQRLSLAGNTETALEAWLARPELALQLFQGYLPWQINEWALKLLLLNNSALPVLSEAQSERFLQSDSPLLVRLVTRRLSEAGVNYKMYKPEVIARTFFLANATQRRQMQPGLIPGSVLAEWDKRFARQLTELVSQLKPGQRLAPRYLEATILLGKYYTSALPLETLKTVLSALIASEREDLLPLIQAVIFQLEIYEVSNIVQTVAGFRLEQRERILVLLIGSVRGKTLDYYFAYGLVFNQSEWLRAAGWQLLAAGQVNEYDWNRLWDRLLSPYTEVAILFSALASSAAFNNLLKTPEKVQTLQARFISQPELINQLSAQALTGLLKNAPLSFILQLLAAIDDATWQGFKPRLIAELEADARMQAFWQAVWQAVPADNSGQLAARLVNDSTFATTFLGIAHADFLQNADPAFVPLLLNWLASRPMQFSQNSPELLAAAMCKVMEVRLAALRRVDEVGMTMPFALRLLESGLPETIAKGKEFFEAPAPGDARELEYALTICDSPDKNVQFYGREYIQARRDRLPIEKLIGRLAEHPDTLIQEVVASQLLATPELGDAIPTTSFDKAVLRGRNKGRRAKEMVKERIKTAPPPTVDKATLLEMARSRTPRDAEWAWQQLARLAQAGEVIEGLTIEGVNGV